MQSYLVWFIFATWIQWASCTLIQEKLNRDLMQRYGGYQRLAYVDAIAQVNLQVIVLGVNQVAELENIIKVKSIYIMNWTDPRLAWDPKQYGGIEYINLPANNNEKMAIWIPELCVKQEKNHLCLESIMPDFQYVYVHYNGTVMMKYHVQHKLIKSISFMYFPYDKQEVDMSILPWMFDATQINYICNTTNNVIKDDQMIQKWKVDQGSNTTKVLYYYFKNIKYQLIDYRVVITRQFDLFTYYIIPTILIVMTSFSTFLIRNSFDIQLDKQLKAVFSVLFLQNLIKQYIEYSNEEVAILEFGFDLFFVNSALIILQIVSHFYKIIYTSVNQEKQKSKQQIQADLLNQLRMSKSIPKSESFRAMFDTPSKSKTLTAMKTNTQFQQDRQSEEQKQDSSNNNVDNSNNNDNHSDSDISLLSVSEKKSGQIQSSIGYMSIIKNMNSVHDGSNLRLSTLKNFEKEQLNRNLDTNDVKCTIKSFELNQYTLNNVENEDIKEKSQDDEMQSEQSQQEMVQNVYKAISANMQQMDVEKRRQLSRRVTSVDNLSERYEIFKQAVLGQRRFFILRIKVLNYKYLDLIIFTVIILAILGILSYQLNRLNNIYQYYNKQQFRG